MSELVETIAGSCLCGAVRFTLGGRPPPVGMCHCSKCRKVSGGASNAVLAVRADRFAWLAGQDHLQAFALPSGWGTTFCRTCGAPAPRLTPQGDRYWVPAGSLDADPGPRISGHIFVGWKASWDVIGDDAPQFDATPDAP